MPSVAGGGSAPYAAVKAAVIQYTTSQALTLASKGIRVNCVAPGSIEFAGGSWERRRLAGEALYANVLAKIPFGRLGRARSAGITDLRYGNIQDDDWQGRDRHAQRHDDRRPTPLPAGKDAYVVAATRARAGAGFAGTMIGDGLVPLASALGRHADPALALGVPESRQLVIENANHWDLLDSAVVYSQLAVWLGKPRS